MTSCSYWDLGHSPTSLMLLFDFYILHTTFIQPIDSKEQRERSLIGRSMDVPHVIILPFPVQGHIKPMLMLAELLCHAGLHVTFVNTDHNQNLILSLIDKTTFYNRFPSFRFMSIPDGLPPDHPRTGPQAMGYLISSTCRSVSKTKFKDLLVSLSKPPTCIIADGIMSFAIDVAEELEIPVITFPTFNATCAWVYFHLQKLIQTGEIPLKGDDEDMDRPITSIPKLETLLRRRDLPNICRLDIENPILQFFIGQTSTLTRASALILNTFHELEAPIISQLHSIFSKVYTIGPSNTLLKSRMIDSPPPDSSNGSLREQDRACMTWLDSQPSKSVIYVSFGSLVLLSRDQLLEFWHGLVNSEKQFLWVIRPDLIWEENGMGETAAGLVSGPNERGYIVGWAPQEEVLAHPAIGGFLTHSGWNSTLESIWAGVPMICWPQFIDQQVNSRCVSEMWRIGLDMKDTCDRSTVEKMVRDLTESKRDEMQKSADEIAKMARDSVREGGSSYCNIEKLIEDIRSINSAKCASNR